MDGVGFVDVAHVSVVLPDGRVLLDDVSFRVGEGVKAALVGANGAGKTTLLRVVAGDLAPSSGAVARSGGLGVMRQFIGSVRDSTTVRELLLGLAPPALRAAGEQLEAAEWALAEVEDEPTQLRYAAALAAWGDAGGYDAEVLWDTVTVAALGAPLDRVQHRTVRTLSGGEQKRLALEALLRGPDEVLLLDEPDNYLDVPGKRWLEEPAAGDAEDRPVRQPRPRAARPHRRPGGHRRGALGLGARRRLRDVRAGPGRPAGAARRAAPALGRRSTPGSRSWSAPCSSRPRTATGWPVPLPRDADPAAQVRGGGAAAGAAGRAEGDHAAAAAGAPASAR